MAETEGATAVAGAGPRVITIQRRWALAGAVATALVVAALIVAVALGGGDSRGDHPPFGAGGPGPGGAMPGQVQGLPAPPEGGFPGGEQAAPGREGPPS